jgi:hypothetical protein
MPIEEKNSGCEGRSGPAADTKSTKGDILHNEPGIVKELAKIKLSRLPASPLASALLGSFLQVGGSECQSGRRVNFANEIASRGIECSDLFEIWRMTAF